MTAPTNALYPLLPVVHRMKDDEAGGPLANLLAVVEEQVAAVEADIAQLYDNWFIETAESWVVPYIADLIGYLPVPSAGLPSRARSGRELARDAVLVPRREVANTVRSRRRKGTRAVLDQLAADVAGWSARAVELARFVAWLQHVNHVRPGRGGLLDVHDASRLALLGGPFDPAARTADVRRVASTLTPGRPNLPALGVFTWRLRPYQVSHTAAHRVREAGPNCFTFSALGHDGPLFTWPAVGNGPHPVADEASAPGPIRPGAFEDRTGQRPHASDTYYGTGHRDPRSLVVEVEGWPRQGEGGIVPAERVVPADLSDWERYRPRSGTVAVDVARGRLLFPPRQAPRGDVVVSYTYGFPGDIAGGQYERPPAGLSDRAVTRVDTDDLADPAALLAELRDPSRPFTVELASRWAPTRRARLESWDGTTTTGPLWDQLVDDLVAELHEAIDGPDLAPDPDRLGDLGPLVDALPADLPLRLRNRRILELGLAGLLGPGFAEYHVDDEAGGGAGPAEPEPWPPRFPALARALERWNEDQPRHAVITFVRSGVYQHDEDVGDEVVVRAGASLAVRAASGVRPVLLVDPAISIALGAGARLILDGLIIGGGAVQLFGPSGRSPGDGDGEAGDGEPAEAAPVDDYEPPEPEPDPEPEPEPEPDPFPCGTEEECDPRPRVTIRHSTIVPGRSLSCDCAPRQPTSPSLIAVDLDGHLRVDRSIVGAIRIEQSERTTEPVRLTVEDSAVDATDPEGEAIGAGGSVVAHAALTVRRATVIGRVEVHAVDLGENSLFLGPMLVARRQRGCLRFSWVAPDSRTPPRHRCQPDLAEAQALETLAPADQEARDLARLLARLAAAPRFDSIRYGAPDYARLAPACPGAITRGADDEAEMGVWHDLYEPIRVANLRSRLDEYTPAGMEAGLIFVT